MVHRGSGLQAAPASCLRPGDDVKTLRKGVQPVTEIRPLTGGCDVFRVVFKPDVPVAALSADAIDAIDTKGDRLTCQTRRGSGGCYGYSTAMPLPFQRRRPMPSGFEQVVA